MNYKKWSNRLKSIQKVVKEYEVTFTQKGLYGFEMKFTGVFAYAVTFILLITCTKALVRFVLDIYNFIF